MPNMDSVANGGVESSAESPEAEQGLAALKCSPAAAASKGRGLRRWRRIRREQQREGNTAAAAVGDGDSGDGGVQGDENSAQQHKRRLPAPAGPPKTKHEAGPVVEEEEEGSTASVEPGFIQPAAKLDPGLGLLVETAGFSIGADPDDSEDRSGRSSTASSAPRHAMLVPRERERRGAATLHGKHPRAAARSRADRPRLYAAAAGSTETGGSSVESELRSSDAMKETHFGVGDTGNGARKGVSDPGDHSDDEGQRSEEVRSTSAGGYYKENGNSVSGRLAQRNADSDDDTGVTSNEGSVRNAQNGELQPCSDPYADSVSLLQRTQEALENETENFVAIGKVPSDEFDINDDEWSGSVDLEEPIQEGSERIKHLESRLEEVSTLIKERDSRILELETLGRMQPGNTVVESTNLLLSQSELELLYGEKIEAEIQCIILARAYKTLATVAGDQMALYEAQKSLCEDYKQLGLKLLHAENRAIMLEEKAEKLQMQCKELSRNSEVLQLQSKANRVSLFCVLQFILLCVAIGTYLMQLQPSSNEFVPT